MDAPRATGTPAPRRARAWLPTLAVAAGCVVALLVWRWAFYEQSHPVVDHVAYEVQAERLLDGDLFLPATDDAPEWAVRFTAPTEDGRVFKYLPGTAALGAASLWISDGFDLALVATLVGLVVATSGVAGRLGWSPGRRALAAGLVGASPVVLSNSSVLLSYLPALALCTGALWMVLAATGAPGAAPAAGAAEGRTNLSWVLAGGAGLVLGAALTVRQLDVVAWIVVLGFWCAVAPTGDRGPSERWWRTGAFVVGLLPGVAGVLALNHVLTGDVLELPFTVVSPDDGFGWGNRRVLAGDALESFDALEGLRATPRALFDLAMWTLAGPALAVGAALAVWRGRRSPVHLLLLALGASIPVAYLFHWANAHAVQAGFYMEVGPFYLLPCVVPLALLGVEGLAALPRRAVLTGVGVAVVVQAAFLAEHLSNRWEVEHATASFAGVVAADVHGAARTS